MARAPGTATVVIGLGNPVRGDDGVGLRVAEALVLLLAAEPVEGVRVASSRRGGLELLDLLEGADRAIVVDCLDLPGAAPGRVRQISLEEVSGAARLAGSHDVGLAAALEIGRLAGVRVPASVEIFGVEAALDDRIEEGLTPEVEAAVLPLARLIHAALRSSTSP